MKLCTESTYCPAETENICDRFENEPSEIGERGQIIGTGYCIHCGHSRECHEELTAEQIAEFTGDGK